MENYIVIKQLYNKNGRLYRKKAIIQILERKVNSYIDLEGYNSYIQMEGYALRI